MRILCEYGLPSLRYILTVHILNDTQLKELNSMQTKYITIWNNVPKHGATHALFSNL